MIKITQALLDEKFNEFNKKYFNGEVKKTSFVISHNRSRFGQFRPRTWTIEISTAWVRSERDYWNTLLHEMIHALVRQRHGVYAQSHGYEWKEIASDITRKTNGQYGVIQRVGGGQDKTILRSANVEKFVVFTDKYGKLSIGKYRDEDYVMKLKRLGAVMSGTTIYYLTSSDNELARFNFRKVNTRSVRWNYANMPLESIMSRSEVIRSEFYTKLSGVA